MFRRSSARDALKRVANDKAANGETAKLSQEDKQTMRSSFER